jgi:succinyl-CoA synthetase beta subunit
VLAGGRGLGTFKNGLKGGVHIVTRDKVEEIAGISFFPCLLSKFLVLGR